jgi:hypothetical protein
MYHQNQFVISDPPIKPLLQPENQAEFSALPELNESSHGDEAIPSGGQTTSEGSGIECPSILAVSQPPVDEAVVTIEASRLTIDQVKKKWEFVLRRVRQKKDGAKVAALLRGYDLLGVDDSADLPIVILKAKSLFHYKAIQKGGYQPTIEWAFNVELEQECRLLLLSWEASLPS